MGVPHRWAGCRQDRAACKSVQLERRRPASRKIEIPETPTEIEHTISLPPRSDHHRACGRRNDRATRGESTGRFHGGARPRSGCVLLRLIQGNGPRRQIPTRRAARPRDDLPPHDSRISFRSPSANSPASPRTPGSTARSQALADKRSRSVISNSQHGREIVLRVVDPDGQPVARRRNSTSATPTACSTRQAPPARTPTGQSTLVGLPIETSTVVDIIATKRSLGATVEIPDAASAGADNREIEVRLQPLLSLSGRVLDEAGKPIAGPIVHLYRDVIYPGQSGRSFGLPVGTLNQIKDDGTYTFDHLIPGATYNTQVEASGYPNATTDHVLLKPGPPIRLNDFRLPIADQSVRGIVVDTRGKPLAGVIVNLQRTNQTTPILRSERGRLVPRDATLAGRFHLTSPAARPDQVDGLSQARGCRPSDQGHPLLRRSPRSNRRPDRNARRQTTGFAVSTELLIERTVHHERSARHALLVPASRTSPTWPAAWSRPAANLSPAPMS